MNTPHADHAQEKVCGYEYTVRRGDSFYLIANRLGVPLRDLLEANSDINPARLVVGDVLCIPMEEDDAPSAEDTPPKPPVPETPAEDDEVPPEDDEVPPEDAFPEAEEDLDVPAVDPDAVPDAPCPGGTAHTVIEGETIADVQLRANVNRYTLAQANPDTDLERLAAGQVLCIPPESAACPPLRLYLIQQDETLESVALRLNVSLGALLRANPCLAPSEFTAGQRICVP